MEKKEEIAEFSCSILKLGLSLKSSNQKNEKFVVMKQKNKLFCFKTIVESHKINFINN